MATRAKCDERSEILADALARSGEVLRRQAARNARHPAEAEDALQEACVDFLRYYDGPPGTDALRYLMLSVKHRAWALGGRAASRYASEVEVTRTDALVPGEARVAVLCERPGPHEHAAQRERHLALAEDLSRLKPDERTAISLLALGCSYREIGARQGWTHTKVNRCLAEGRDALRRLAAT